MSILRTHDGTVIIVAGGHVIAAPDFSTAISELRRRQSSLSRRAAA